MVLKKVFGGFLGCAGRFMGVVDGAAKLDRSDLLTQLQTTLVELYAAAMQLPDVEPKTETEDKLPVSFGLQPLYDAMVAKLDSTDKYWEVFDPTKRDEPVLASLTDGIIDIYRDLKEGITLSEMGASVSEVIWHWRFAFLSHWGFHAADAIRAIHWIRYHKG